MFYSILHFITFVALVSFIVAFLSTKLPGTLQETKSIIFNMLVFALCAFFSSLQLPRASTVHGRRGAILSSNSRLLAFFSKYYIITIRPDLNKKKSIKRLN